MKLPPTLNDLLNKAKEHAGIAQKEFIRRGGTKALVLARPQLESTPTPLRPLAETLAGVAALFVLAWLVALAALGGAFTLVAMSAIYVILTEVLGLDIDLDPSAF